MWLRPAGPPPRVMLGCETRESGAIYSQTEDGLLGLGRAADSVVSQLAAQGAMQARGVGWGGRGGWQRVCVGRALGGWVGWGGGGVCVRVCGGGGRELAAPGARSWRVGGC